MRIHTCEQMCRFGATARYPASEEFAFLAWLPHDITDALPPCPSEAASGFWCREHQTGTYTLLSYLYLAWLEFSVHFVEPLCFPDLGRCQLPRVSRTVPPSP